jgi:hypothetical protein
MSTAVRRLVAVLVLVLGVAILLAHLRQPTIPALPGRGCITTTFGSPDTGRTPAPRVELESCVHISETLFYLNYFSAPDDSPSQVFEASGPEGPDRWNEHLAVSWQGPDTLAVTYDDTVHMWRTLTSLHGVNVVYTQLARTGL